MRITELFEEPDIQNLETAPAANISAIFQATKAFSQHFLFDMVEDHLPENTRIWQIQWIMNEDMDEYRPQFIFAKTKNEAIKKFNERMKHPSLGFVAIESIKEISFNQLTEGEVVQFPGKKKKQEYIPPYANFSDKDAQEWANSIINNIKQGLQHGEAEEYGIENWIDDILGGEFPYDGTGKAQRMIIKIMLSHPDMNQIDFILKRKYNYNLSKILFDSFNQLTEGEVVPFTPRNKRSNDQKYNDALAKQTLQNMSDDELNQRINDLQPKMSIDEVQKYAHDIVSDIENNIKTNIKTNIRLENISEWMFEFFASELPYNEQASRQILNTIISDPRMKKINHTLIMIYDYNLMKNLISWSEENVVTEKKKKKKVKDEEGAWNKAEKYTKYDPPQTGNKGVSARRGFVGG